jgi:hypothetical protein
MLDVGDNDRTSSYHLVHFVQSQLDIHGNMIARIWWCFQGVVLNIKFGSGSRHNIKRPHPLTRLRASLLESWLNPVNKHCCPTLASFQWPITGHLQRPKGCGDHSSKKTSPGILFHFFISYKLLSFFSTRQLSRGNSVERCVIFPPQACSNLWAKLYTLCLETEGVAFYDHVPLWRKRCAPKS